MRIALIVRRLNTRGGIQRQALSLAKELVKLGYKIKLYTFQYDREKCFSDLIGDIPVIELPVARCRPTGGFFGFVRENRMARDLALLIDRDTDILHPHDAMAHHVAYYFKKCVKNIPSVWQMNELPTMRWPLELLGWAENPNFHDIPRRPLFLKKLIILLKTRYEKFFIIRQDIITVFDTFHKNMLAHYIGRDAVLVSSGVDSDRFPFFPKESPKKGEPLYLLSSGVFLSYRRFEDIIAALPDLIRAGHNPALTILGDYTTDKKYYAALKALCKKMGVEKRVTFFGPYTDEELIGQFQKSHIFIFPHLQSQALSVYEAMLCGVPTVVTPLSGTYETLEHKKTAIFVEPKNPRLLGEVIAELADNTGLYLKLHREGREYVIENFSWSEYAQKMLMIFVKSFAQKNR